MTPIKVESFTKTYEGRKVLNYSGGEFERGKIYSIIGANGSGKSTFAKCLSGLAAPDGKKRAIAGDIRVGYMPQKSFPFHLSVLRNVMITKKRSAENLELAEKYIDELELEALSKKKADKLSGGETARMALARIMMTDYEILILDEPTASMDVKSTLVSEKLIKEYRDRTNACVILVTHSITQALRGSDYTMFFREGVLEEFGKSRKMIEAPKNPETKRFIEFYGV